MKTYTIIGGVNGTGKSSLTGVLKAETTDLGRIIDVDKITASLGGTAFGRKGSHCQNRRLPEKRNLFHTGNHPIRPADRENRTAGKRTWVLYPPLLCGP